MALLCLTGAVEKTMLSFTTNSEKQSPPSKQSRPAQKLSGEWRSSDGANESGAIPRQPCRMVDNFGLTLLVILSLNKEYLKRSDCSTGGMI
ncbi:unnamed protein product [Ceratitis capitata]|uniref:(Mediterranean fruit fly) hypothetical protein n=1 Tax=Ceratitis capitata TaxID=7213 RepID=A0A811V0Y6_CERCA|nr:unnamed protein product [Ceratitis capitata]